MTRLRQGICLTITLLTFIGVAHADLIVFSGRKEPLIKPVITLFEKETGISVLLKTGQSATLSQQILQELPDPSADVFIGKESGSLEYLRMKKALAPYTSKMTARIPAAFKAADGSWIGVSGRSRAVIYNTDLIRLEDVPRRLEQLSDSKYRGKIAAVNAGNESFIAWVSALRLALGDDVTEGHLSRMLANDIQLLSKSHTDVRKSVGRGEYPLGLINHYYYHLQKREVDPELTRVGIVYLDQEDGQRGELVNVCAAGIVAGAKHEVEAQRFIDFLTSDEAQKIFAEVNFEFPLVSGVETHPEVVRGIGCPTGSALECLRVMDVDIDDLGDALNPTLEMLDDLDWY